MVITYKVTVLVSMQLLPLSCISESIPALHLQNFLGQHAKKAKTFFLNRRLNSITKTFMPYARITKYDLKRTLHTRNTFY